jgi:hypothetical protein
MNWKLIRSASTVVALIGFVLVMAAVIVPGEVSAARERAPSVERAATASLDAKQLLGDEALEVRRRVREFREQEAATHSHRVSMPLLLIGAVLFVLGFVGRVWSVRPEQWDVGAPI